MKPSAAQAGELTTDSNPLDNRQPGSPRDRYPRGIGSFGILELIGAIIAPTALITGLLYYFGWARTQAIFAYFGVDTSLVEYSPSDYVLRSSTVTFDALVRMTFLALILMGLHRLVV
ncbi:MAG: hypothetical protein LC808_36940, partial [Actinobacteria bacterium]|nr:hypothetical protein [Actinomycetota bacterium]